MCRPDTFPQGGKQGRFGDERAFEYLSKMQRLCADQKGRERLCCFCGFERVQTRAWLSGEWKGLVSREKAEGWRKVRAGRRNVRGWMLLARTHRRAATLVPAGFCARAERPAHDARGTGEQQKHLAWPARFAAPTPPLLRRRPLPPPQPLRSALPPTTTTTVDDTGDAPTINAPFPLRPTPPSRLASCSLPQRASSSASDHHFTTNSPRPITTTHIHHHASTSPSLTSPSPLPPPPSPAWPGPRSGGALTGRKHGAHAPG